MKLGFSNGDFYTLNDKNRYIERFSNKQTELFKIEYYLSVCGQDNFHAGLFAHKKQRVIIQAIPNKNIPIILESSLTDYADAKKEYFYVYNNLK